MPAPTIPSPTKRIQKTQKTSVSLIVLFCNQITDTCLAGQAVSAASLQGKADALHTL